MRVLDDFYCESCGTKEEHLVENGVKEVVCHACSHVATKVRAVPKFHLDGTDPGFPDAHDRWAKDHENGAKEDSPF